MVFSLFVSSVVEKVSTLQGHLEDLENPQVELHLLHSPYLQGLSSFVYNSFCLHITKA